ncbi:hypothetical protein LPJ66_008857 [Kickxella alabastrina]|uniref:Uncharacterized protein n=1 Tax=Kickxella alabastrina TaxID=61397 RepID=A0ACC1ID23_9FUNG|nr:hypothetical protein LPJ66_008857 [Kickxella alabastrina]
MGCFEAGYVPGFIYLCSFWYTRKQIAPRLALFFSAGMFAGIWAGPLAARLQKIKGGLEGYQYIFLIEAAITVGLALIMWVVLDNYPETARFLTAEERAAGLRMLSEDKAQSARAPFRPQQVLRALSDWTLWGYAVIFWASALGGATQAIFGPTLIAAMGYESTHAQVLSAVPSACGFVVQIASMFFPRVHSRYSPWIMVCSGLACAFYAVIASVESTRVRFAFLCLANAALSPNMPLVSMWMSMNVLGVTKKGVAAAVTVMFGGVSGLIGAHVYRERDYPRYRFGHIFVCACNALIFLVALALQLYFRWENQRRDKKARGGIVVVDGSAMSENVIEETDDKRPDHRYTW